MKCPKCGYWNRDTFPKCFRCGEELPQKNALAQNRVKPEMPKEGAPKTYIQINEAGRATSAVDSRDQLAKEMENLLERKKRGEEEQRRLRENSARQGFAPSARIAQTMTGRRTFPIPQNTSYIGDDNAVEGNVRPDAIPVASRRVIGYDEEILPEPRTEYVQSAHGRRRDRRIKLYRHSFLRRFGKIIAAVLIIAALGGLGYEYLYKPYAESMNADSENKYEVQGGVIYNDWRAHIIKLRGEDGQSYWITELKKSYPVTGGWATIEVEDYKWYEHMESLSKETVTAVMTPYLVTAAGERKKMEQITFEVSVPESTLELITPSTLVTDTFRQLYEIQVRVEKGSTVTVNNEDYTPLVNTDGVLTFQAQIDPGDNPFIITARAQYCRDKTETIIINRPKQDIRLDLAADIATRYSSQTMKITGTTVSWADITVESPYQNLDTTALRTNGTFSFEAVFNKIGTNTIKIKATVPDSNTVSTVEHDVYYVPVADVYTRKAWSMKDQYTDYLNNAEKRIQNTQIYQCDGAIVEILSTNPQMGVMELSDGSSRRLLLTNNTYDTWQIGSVYRVFADAYGLYDGAPWLNARYSYIQRPKEENAE